MWKSCGGRGGINRERRVKSTPRERTSARAMFVPARGERKNGPASAFSAIISSGAKDKDATRLSDCAARRLSIHAGVNAMPAPHLRGEFGKNKNNKNSHKSSILLASCAESCTPSSRWMRFFLLAAPRQLSYYRELALSAVHLHGRSQPLSPLTHSDELTQTVSTPRCLDRH